jgi:hypothetical protein
MRAQLTSQKRKALFPRFHGFQLDIVRGKRDFNDVKKEVLREGKSGMPEDRPSCADPVQIGTAPISSMPS